VFQSIRFLNRGTSTRLWKIGLGFGGDKEGMFRRPSLRTIKNPQPPSSASASTIRHYFQASRILRPTSIKTSRRRAVRLLLILNHNNSAIVWQTPS
jgi:hypothetical protein